MNLKKFKLTNFRKFTENNNEINFALTSDYGEDVNIAPKTTLIIGQNNGGKTTVIEALKRVINGIDLKAEDFNFDYLRELLNGYNDNKDKMISPVIEFELTIQVDMASNDLLTNIIPLLTIGDLDSNELIIEVKWEVADEGIYRQKVKDILEKDYDENQEFAKFLELINNTTFKYTYYNSNKDLVKNNILKKLINIEAISANNITSNDCLSRSFSKIVDYRYNHLIDENEKMDDIDKKIDEINKQLTEYLKENYSESINKSLKSMLSSKKCQILLKVDMNFNNLISNIVKYEYIEKDKFIPENQFGLGYTNLMMIVADINRMVSSLLSEGHKNVNSQIIITTHSAHILNSKIHEGNSFNDINYITTENNNSKNVALNDQIIQGNNDKKNFQYLKKHIKFGVSEMFFSDAVIFVEGITEYVLLKHVMKENEDYNKYYISIFLLNGAYAQKYEKLIKILNIPALIITDIDFKRENFEKNKDQDGHEKKYLQMTYPDLENRKSTNGCIKHYYEDKTAKEIIDGVYYKKDNLMVTCQKDEIQGYYATSFEEALILTNCNNDSLKKVITRVNGNLTKCVEENMEKRSYEIQMRLSKSKAKSEFANEILYEVITNDQHGIELPKYIIYGLDFIKEKLGEKDEL